MKKALKKKNMHIQEKTEWHWDPNNILTFLKGGSLTNMVRFHFCEPNIVRTFPWKKISSVPTTILEFTQGWNYKWSVNRIVYLYNLVLLFPFFVRHALYIANAQTALKWVP